MLKSQKVKIKTTTRKEEDDDEEDEEEKTRGLVCVPLLQAVQSVNRRKMDHRSDWLLDMTHPYIIVLGYSEASMLLRKSDSVDIHPIIAIHGQREYPVDLEGIPHSLVLQFDDTEAPNESDPLEASRLRLRQREAAEIGLTLTPPTIEHARRIIEFARAIHKMEGTLLCHCQGGVSRSPAAALLSLATWTGPGRERDCVRQLLSARPCAAPHPDLVRFGDALLKRNGALMDELQRAQPY